MFFPIVSPVRSHHGFHHLRWLLSPMTSTRLQDKGPRLQVPHLAEPRRATYHTPILVRYHKGDVRMQIALDPQDAPRISWQITGAKRHQVISLGPFLVFLPVSAGCSGLCWAYHCSSLYFRGSLALALCSGWFALHSIYYWYICVIYPCLTFSKKLTVAQVRPCSYPNMYMNFTLHNSSWAYYKGRIIIQKVQTGEKYSYKDNWIYMYIHIRV